MEESQTYLTAADVSRKLFVEDKENYIQVDTSKQKTMATLAQAPTHAFQSISNNTIDESTTVLNNISHHVTVSKIKSHQATLANHTISKQNSVPAAAPVVHLQNGSTPPRPHTTSQNHPPKIKLLNKNPAFNSAPAPTDINGVEEEGVGEIISEKEVDNVIDEKTDCSQLGSCEETTQDIPINTLNSEKKPSSQNVTPIKCNTSTSPKQQSFEYSSSPSSTTSSLNRENSLDYKDSTGVDLHEFMVKTLRENPRDRLMLLKLERDFTDFINDYQKGSYKYPPMTSYHRMLIHRVAAYFGLDHNVDSSGKSVIISKTPASRCPETLFQSYCSREYTDEEISAVPKSILPRSASSDENVTPPRYASPLSSIDRRFLMEDKRSRSIEEREEDYNKAKERIFSKDSLETSSAVGPVDGLSNRSHESHNAESMLSEKEAAIAAVAAATGSKTSSSKRLNDRKTCAVLSSTPLRHFVEGYSPSTPTAIAINPQTGQPYIGADGNPVYYQTNYPQSPQVAYVSSSGHPYMQQHQHQQAGQYIPAYYANNSNVGQAGSQYYMVQQTSSGQVMYIPTQAPIEQSTSPESTVVLSPQQQISYQDYINQWTSMNERRSSAATDDSLEKHQQQTTSPTSPVDPVVPKFGEYPAHGRQVVYVQNERPVQGPIYQQQSSYPLQYYQSVPGGYVPCTISQYTPQEGGQYNNMAAAAQNPSLSQRAQSPGVLQQQHFVNSMQQQQTVHSVRPLNQPQQLQSSHAVSRARFVSGIMPNPRPSTPMYIPLATPHGNMLLTGQQYSNNVSVNANGYPVQTVYRTDKMPANIADNGDYKLDHREGRSVLTMNHHKPLLQIQPSYQHAHSYVSHPQRFVSPSSYANNQYIRPVGQQQPRRYRPPRHNTSNNQQIRISRPNSNSSEADQKTVSHILEIYEFPDTVTSDADAIFDEIKSFGARILKINGSSPQLLSSPHGNASNQRPTILAIFKSAGEAQKALETVTSPYYKLRVSQKSPTHFAGGDYTGGSSPIKN